MKRKSLLFLLLCAIFAPWAAKAQTTGCEAIGETSTSYGAGGSGGAGYVPIDIYYKYSYEQMVYDGSEMPTTITSISFKYKSQYAITEKDDVDIYLGETTSATLSSWMSADDLTLVYSGAMDFPASPDGAWVEFTFNQNQGSFSHDQSKYIVVVINDKSNGYPSSYYSSMYFCYQNCASGAHKYLRNDSYGQYTVPPTQTASNASQCPIVRFCGTFPVICCPKPKDLACTATTGTPATATFTWTNGGEETQWQLEYSLNENFTSATQVTINQTDLVQGAYTLTTGLTAENKYYARIRAYCPSCEPNYSDWSNTADFKPTNAIPQTVCDGTAPGTTSTTNSYIPVYGNYAENYNKDEFIIPATTEGMSNMDGGTISQMTFYLSSPASDLWGEALYRVFMKEVNESAFANTSYYGTDDATIVYEGALDGTQSTMTIEFTTNYVYNGGNLLVGIYEYNKGTYKSCSFSGIASTNGSMYKNSSTSLESITTGTLQNFIPKTTFSYLPCATPKPRNLQVTNLAPTSATLSWEAPTTATPTGYGYQYKQSSVTDWPTNWTNIEYLNVALSLNPYTNYDFRVRANYTEGFSNPVEISFKTLASCATPTNFVASTTPGQGTKATLTWVRGYDEEAWVLEYALDDEFTQGLQQVTDGFIINGNNVTCNLTTLTPETHYYARLQSDCGGDTYSQFCFTDFTVTNYVDYTFNENATSNSSSSYIPFRGNYVAYQTNSQFIIPQTSLGDLAGGTVKKLTFYSTSTYANVAWGDASFKVYVAEVDNTTFASNPTSLDWSAMEEVYSGSLSVVNSQMVIELDQEFTYSGTKNLMIGFEKTAVGTNATVAWIYKSASNTCAYSYNNSSATGALSYGRSGYLPKMTFNYRPTATPRPIITVPVTTTDVTATIAWTKPSDNVTGYKYQYKLASATEWPTSWTELNDANAVSVTVPNLTPNTSYDFQIKAVYAEGESIPSSTSFATACPVATPVPYTYDFETAPKFNCWTVATGSSVTRYNYSDNAHLGSYYLRFEGTQENVIEMPSFEQATNTLRLEYWVRPESYTNSSCGSFAIGYYNANNEFVALKTYAYNSTTNKYDGWESSTYKKEVIDFDVDANNDGTPDVPDNANIVLRQFNTTSNWYWFVDDVKVKVIPTCEDVNDVHYVSFTNHSATIAWTADAAQAAWQIAYKAGANFDPYNAEELATATVVEVTSNPYLFDKNLEAATTYYMYVRGNCTASSNGYGDWSDSYATFTTLAATPAPSNFVATNPASAKVDLVWTAGGGDTETWELYYVASSTDPEAPTATTTATKTVDELPTTEHPYVLDGLDPVTKYYAWIRAKHVYNNEVTYSDWVALTGDYFETLDACPTPTGLAYTNLTSVSADLSWVGSTDVESYTVQYRVSEQLSNPVLNEAFGSSAPTGWTGGNVALVEGVADVSASTSTSWSFGTQNSVLDGNHAWMNLWISSYSTTPKNNWLVTPGIETTGNQVLSFDVAYTAYSSSTPVQNCPTHSFGVYASTDKVNWTLLRVWNNSGSSYVLDEISNQGQTVSISLDGFADQTIYIGFLGHAETSAYDNNIHVDNVKVGTVIPAGSWANATTDETSQSYTLTGLTGGTKYDVHVKSNCTSGEYCEPVSFTTLAEGNKVFTNAANDGKWGNDNNWMPTGAPAITENAILRANATIESGCEAEAKKITFEGTPTRTLTIADGGQLKTDNTVTATVKKTISAYTEYTGEYNGGYYLISTPLDVTYGSASTYGMITDNLGSSATPTTSTYDLYKWSTSSSATYDEWRNYRTSSFDIANGTGYLYASKNGVELTFTGTVKANNTDISKTPSYTTDGTFEFNGWNLYANPFVCDAYINDVNENGSETPMAFYRMNEQGDGYQAATGAIHPMEGIFVQATKTGQSFKFTRTAPVSNPGQGNLNINLAQVVTTRNEQPATDNAIIRFGGSSTLEKFSFRENSSKIFIPMEGKNYAVVSAEQTGEIPVSFKAEKNGTYSLNFTSQEVSFSYLHLIDNLTGNDVDLLANPSYSFDAQVTDYAQRFKLVFATGSSAEGDSFGFVNGMGNLCIFGIEGEATVQVIDILGHVITSDTFSGSYERKLNVAPGVYMIRLINGNDVKVQKIVVR